VVGNAILSAMFRNIHFTVCVFMFINPIFDSQVVCLILQQLATGCLNIHACAQSWLVASGNHDNRADA